MENRKRAINNIIYGIIGQLITIALGIVIPRLTLTNLGSEINGLMNSVNCVISYLSLLEAGVGATSLQALYGPVGKKDYESINSILAATKKYYDRTGTIYFFCVVFISLFYSFIVDSDISKVTVFIVAFLSGLPMAMGYYLQGKYKILLQAEGKKYIITNLTTITSVAISITKVILLQKGYGVIPLQMMYFIYSLIQIICISLYIKKNYKWLDLKVSPNLSALEQKNSALIHQIATLIFNNTDMLVLTAFCNLKIVSVYAMYNMLINLIKTALSSFNSGITFLMGQAFNVDKERFFHLHNAFETCNMMLTFILLTVVNIFITPFLRLYTEGVTDIEYIDKYLPYLFVFCTLLDCGRVSSAFVIDYAGHFRQTVSRTVTEAVINLSVSVISVMHYGIYGVLFGTMVALLYRTNDMIWYVSKKILNKSVIPTYRRWFTNFGVYILVMFIQTHVTWNFTSYGILILSAGIVTIFVAILYLIPNYIFDRPSFMLFLETIKRK